MKEKPKNIKPIPNIVPVTLVVLLFWFLLYHSFSANASILQGNLTFQSEKVIGVQNLFRAGSYASFGLYLDNSPIIVTNTDWPNSLNSIQKNESGWYSQTIEDYPVSYHSLDINSTDQVGLSYQDHYSPYELKYAKKDKGGVWTTTTVASKGPGDNAFQFGSDDQARIAYNDGMLGNVYYYERQNNDQWVEKYIGDSNIGGQRGIVDLGLDQDNNPYILWKSRRLWDPNGYRAGTLLSFFRDGIWHERIVNTESSEAIFDVDAIGSSHILLREGQELKYIVYDGIEMTEETISSNGSYCDIEIGDDGVPRIVFREGHKILYAERNGDNWVVSTVDETERYGDINLELSDDDSPYIVAALRVLSNPTFETYLYTFAGTEVGGIILTDTTWAKSGSC